jgi:hypothetical protein
MARRLLRQALSSVRPITLPLSMRPGGDLAIGAALAGAAVVVLMADCILFQMASGGVETGLALRWLAGAVMPWAVAFVALRAHISAVGGRPSLQEAATIGAAFAGSLLLDAMLIRPESWAELADRVQARLALAALAPLAARLRLEWAPRPRAGARTTPDRRLFEARLVTAAGNYVEVEGPCGRALIRMTIAEAEGRMDPARRLRIHRSILVARDLIERLERDRNGIVGVRLVDGRRLRVGPSYRAAVRGAVEG